MTIDFFCQQCGKAFHASDRMAGTRAKCKGCGTVVVVPSPDAAETVDIDAGQRRPLGEPRSVKPRSGWVTAVAIVNFLMAGLLTLCCIGLSLLGGSLVAALGRFSPVAPGQTAGPPPKVGMMSGVVLIIAAIFSLVVIPKLLAGYGVLKRRQWGRILTLVLGGLSGLSAIASAASGDASFLLSGSYCIFVYVILLNSRFAAEFD